MFRLLLILLVHLEVITGQRVDFGLERTKVFTVQESFVMLLKPQGIKQPYTFNFTRIPQKWYVQNNYLIVPFSALPSLESPKMFNQYLISVVISDSDYKQYKLSLIIIINKNQLILDTTKFDYNINPKSLDLGIIDLRGKTNQESQTNLILKQIINSAKPQFGPAKSDEQYFQQVLTPAQLRLVIETNNLPGLIKAIFIITQRKLLCPQKVQYLLMFFQITSKVIDQKLMKQQQLEKFYFQRNSNGTQSINLRTNDKFKSQKQDSQKQVKLLKIQYQNITNELKKTYTQYSNLYKEAQQEGRLLAQVQAKLEKLRSDLRRSDMDNQNIQPSKLQDNQVIRQVFSKLQKSSQNFKKLITNQILKQQDNKNRQLKKIAQIQKLLDTKKIKYKQIQIILNRIQSQLSSQVVNLYNLRVFQSQPISQFNEDISKIMISDGDQRYRNIISKSQLQQILQSRRDILELQNVIEYLNKTRNEVAEMCYRGKNINDGGLDNIYEINNKGFQILSTNKNLKNAFDNNIYKLQTTKLELSRERLRQSIWDQNLENLSDKRTINVSDYEKDVSCSPLQPQLQSGKGNITKITGSIYTVYSQKFEEVYIMKGPCTSQKIMGDLEVSKMIYWRGFRLSQKVFNTYFILIA